MYRYLDLHCLLLYGRSTGRRVSLFVVNVLALKRYFTTGNSKSRRLTDLNITRLSDLKREIDGNNNFPWLAGLLS